MFEKLKETVNDNILKKSNEHIKTIKKINKKNQKKVRLLTLIACIFIFVAVMITGNFTMIMAMMGIGTSNFQGDFSGNRKFQKLSIKETLYDNLNANINFSDQNVINILVFGLDESEERDGSYSVFRPDTIILASIDLEKKTIQMVSIPRDTYVPIYGRNGKDKINACFYYGAIGKDTPKEEFEGGVNCLKGTVSELLGGIPINYYIGINMDGVPKVVDTIGGVSVNVHTTIYEKNSNVVSIPKGEQILDGAHFLWYARYREYAMGDIGRVEVQQNLMKALFKQMTSSQSIMKLPKAISQVFDIIETDISFKQITSLAFAMKDFSIDNLKTATVPGTFGNYYKISYWVVNQYERVELISEMFGITISPSEQDPKYRAVEEPPATPEVPTQ